jgi:hypothetical protein
MRRTQKNFEGLGNVKLPQKNIKRGSGSDKMLADAIFRRK